MLTHIDLFSGIGGFALAAQWAGFKTVAFVEIEPYAQEIIKQNFGAVMADAEGGDAINGAPKQDWWASTEFTDFRPKLFSDIRTFNGTAYRGATLLTGGFPCQPFSQAGKRRGKEDDRYLWPEMLRVIHEARPTWVLGENVAGIINMELDRCISDLESEGYAVQALVIPACAVDAKHRRDRVWIVAYSERGASGAKRGMAEQLAGQERKGAETGEAGLQSEGRQAHNHDAKQTGKIVGHANEPGSQRHGGLRECAGERVIRQTGQVVADAKAVLPQGCNDRQGEGQFGGSCRWLPEPNVDIGFNGLSARLDGGRVNGQTEKNRPDSMLSRVWQRIEAQELQRTDGRSQRISQTTILRPEVYDQSLCQRHAIAFGLAKEGYSVPWEPLRVVWGYEESARPPYRRKLAEQLAQEYPDLVRELSCFPPPPCSACWADGSWEAGLPRVATGVKKRVDRLKGLGNAIVPQVAYQIIKGIADIETA